MKNSTSLLRLTITIIPVSLLSFALIQATASAASSPPLTGDATRGKTLFEKRCTGCHALDTDREGPRLRNAYGSKAASTPGFKYSAALQGSKIVWDDATLDKWLTETDALVPDNDMDFRVPAAADRADIIRYLKVASGK
jgi:cytochrome c